MTGHASLSSIISVVSAALAITITIISGIIVVTVVIINMCRFYYS